MKWLDRAIQRRTLLTGAGIGLTAGWLTGTHSTAQAATANAAPGAAAADAASPTGEVQSTEYWASKPGPKGDVKLNLWRKRLGAPGTGSARPVLFLVHGSSNSSRTSFDLSVPGKSDYSLMNVFARYGFDVWTMDHDGYGRSGSSGNNSDIASGVVDLTAAMEVVARESGRGKFHFYGTSSGAIRAAAFAQAQPQRVDRLVLVAFTYKGTGSPTLTQRAERVEFYRANNRRTRDRAMIRSIFTRDSLASSYDPAVAEALADDELKFGDQIPTGTYLDMTANLPLVDPTKVPCPVMMIRGDHDGIATVEDLFDFYRQLPNGDRQFAILPNTAHSPGFANNRHLMWYAVRQFLEAPAPVGT